MSVCIYIYIYICICVCVCVYKYISGIKCKLGVSQLLSSGEFVIHICNDHNHKTVCYKLYPA